MGLPTDSAKSTKYREVSAINLQNSLFSHRDRRLPGSRVRLCDRTCGQVRGCVGHTGADGGRAGGGVPSQGRALSDVNQDDGLPSSGGRGTETHPATLRMENRRSAVPQSRDSQQQGQFRVPFHARRRFHGAQPDAGAQKFQPGDNYRRGL